MIKRIFITVLIAIAIVFVPYFLGIITVPSNEIILAKWVIGVVMIVILGALITMVVEIWGWIQDLFNWIKYGR